MIRVMSIAEQVRTIRERKKLTQEELARASGLTTQTVSRVERGFGANIATVDKLAKALNVKTTTLMGGNA